MSNPVSKTFKKAGKAISKGFSSVFGGNALKGVLYGVGLGPVGYLFGGMQGYFGNSIQDLLTMGASAQQRYMNKMTDAQNRAAAEQAKAIEEQNQKSMMQQIRTTRIARAAMLENFASESGVDASGFGGSLSSLGSQYLGDVTYAVRQARYQNAYQNYMNLYRQYQAKAQNSQIKWNNIQNALSLGLSVAGMGFGGAGVGAEEGLQSFQGRFLSYGVQ